MSFSFFFFFFCEVDDGRYNEVGVWSDEALTIVDIVCWDGRRIKFRFVSCKKNRPSQILIPPFLFCLNIYLLWFFFSYFRFPFFFSFFLLKLVYSIRIYMGRFPWRSGKCSELRKCSEFKLQSLYSVHFQTNTVENSMNPLMYPATGYMVPLLFFPLGWLWLYLSSRKPFI